MTELYPVFYFLALITSEAFAVITAILLVLISLVMVTTKFVNMVR